MVKKNLQVTYQQVEGPQNARQRLRRVLELVLREAASTVPDGHSPAEPRPDAELSGQGTGDTCSEPGRRMTKHRKTVKVRVRARGAAG